jgi:hypothetical protein
MRNWQFVSASVQPWRDLVPIWDKLSSLNALAPRVLIFGEFYEHSFIISLRRRSQSQVPYSAIPNFEWLNAVSQDFEIILLRQFFDIQSVRLRGTAIREIH